MHSQSTVAQVLALRESDLGARRIAKRTDLPLGTVKDWLAGRVPTHSRSCDMGGPPEPVCEQCGHACHNVSQLPPEYVYLLGLYLGDGTISKHHRGVFRLRVFLDLRYPQIIDDCAAAMNFVAVKSKVHRLNRTGSFKRTSERSVSNEPSHVEVSSFSKIWPCLFPQCGPGKKHEREIVLTDWQAELVGRYPEQLLRGLIHSDGCRFQNTGRGGWSWPRYSFSNKSDDIRGIFCYACGQIGVHWTAAGHKTIYVSRKADVARLDEFIGPKC